MNWYLLLILFGALQGFILFFAISTSKKGAIKANRILSIFLLLVSLTLTGRCLFTLNKYTLLSSKIVFMGDSIIFILGPMLYFYLLELFKIKPGVKIPRAIHFIPIFMFTLIIIPFLIADLKTYIKLFSGFGTIWAIMEGFSILQNLFYIVLCSFILKYYVKDYYFQNSVEPNIKFYKILLVVTLIGILLWGTNYIIRLTDTNVSILMYHLMWIFISCAMIALGYYSFYNADVFINIDLQKKYVSKPAGLEDIEEHSSNLEKIMKETKPFLNPKLTLSELAEISSINPLLLSRILNEKHKKNFFTYVNSYRIEEFKKNIEKQENKNLTLLALAYESGFNSKTTFNTAFKKLTNQTPREYFKLT